MANAIVNNSEILTLTSKEVAQLRAFAESSENGRYRICLHHKESDSIQEMIIAFRAGSRIAPHKRRNSVKTYHILGGEMDVFVFDEEAECIQYVRLGLATHDVKIFRLSGDYYLMPVPGIDGAIIHEISTGPFIPGEDEYLACFQDMTAEELERKINWFKREVN